ncbi:MAG TPA: spermidine/putrescine ABC transporter permease [Acidobacteria bacterium]|nr:spermidine/putrescine ABC transporter permease [Acidobacteriota bacterium]
MSRLQALSTFLYRRPRLALALLLGPPLLWLGVVYLGSLGALLLQSFFQLDHYTGQVVREPTLATWRALASRANLDIVLRTAGMATAVTLAAAVLAFPLAFYMAFRASRRVKALLYLAVMLPLWSSYLVRVYAWKLILAKEGILTWFLARLHLSGAVDGVLALPWIGGPSLSLSPVGMFLAFLYVWLPYMVLPVEAALERVPRSLLEASEDLGAQAGTTFRRVILPLAVPGVVAGSLFTFSLTLGDFIVPSVLGNSSYFIGQAVLAHQGTSGNLPLAAAFTMVPMAVMAVYLLLARRAGALDAL